MKYAWITAGVIGLVALAAGCLSYFCFHQPIAAHDSHGDDALNWLKTEFKLTDDQFARVRAMHETYELVCVDHCQAIADSRKELQRLREAGALQPEIAAAMTKAASVDAQCVASTQNHIKEIAAVIGGQEGNRYLSIVMPRVSTFDHTAPATLDMQNPSTHDAPGRK